MKQRYFATARMAGLSPWRGDGSINMSRNLYILATALFFLAAASFAMSWILGSHQPDLPSETQMWRTMALGLFLLGAISCLIGTVTNMFEQASRRHDERERRRNGKST